MPYFKVILKKDNKERSVFVKNTCPIARLRLRDICAELGVKPKDVKDWDWDDEKN